jgi:hypothetical protein
MINLFVISNILITIVGLVLVLVEAEGAGCCTCGLGRV